MFHHFHDKNHVKGQGSIDATEFSNIIKFYSNNFNILSAEIFLKKFFNNGLDKNDVCITFDDNLKCQYDVALPILNELKIKAFWFIYTSPLNGYFEKLETYRFFRSFYFNSFIDFYETFFNELNSKKKYQNVIDKLNEFDYKNYLKEFSFYTKEDKIFRYTRDNLLGEDIYYEVMDSLMENSEISLDSELHEKLWMTKNEIYELKTNGHIIGLHSHSHPTRMGDKSFEFQEHNYSKNKSILEKIIDDEIICMSHPCNSYNQDTLKILKKLKLKLGFRANLSKGFCSDYEIPRIDHSEILKLL